LDRAIALFPQFTAFLQQDMYERAGAEASRARLNQLVGD